MFVSVLVRMLQRLMVGALPFATLVAEVRYAHVPAASGWFTPVVTPGEVVEETDAMVMDPLKPLLLAVREMVSEPRVIATAPTFLTMIVIFGLPVLADVHAAPLVPVPVLYVESSIDMLDCAAWFCAPC